MAESIKFRGKIHRMEVAVNSHLKHPLILGTDWPAFTQLLGIVCADASWPTGRGQEEAAARTGEAPAGPAPPASGETRASEGVRTPELDDFPLEQSRDETLKNAYDRVRSIDGQLLRPDVPLSYPYFSLIKERLYRVTQVPVQWTELCQQALTKVKAALCGGPLLHSPNFDLPFLLQTDASDRGLGAVLAQVVGGEERPVLYLSRKLSKRETRYSTVENECLAIRWAVLTLRYYLLGREFTLCSDHAPLQWLHRMKDTNVRITRWYLALQPFKFKVVHRPGVQMAVADFLSRNGGGGLQAGGLTGLRRAVGVCGVGGVERRNALRGERVRRRAGNQWASE